MIAVELCQPKFTALPTWPCPSCGHGRLILQGKSPTVSETHRSAFLWEKVGEPGDFQGRFSAFMECDNPACRELVVASGLVTRDTYGDLHDHDFESWPVFWVKAITPAPPLFPFPENLPKPVKAALQVAFALFWIDLESSANKIRLVVELAMTDRGFPREKSAGTLAARIKKFNDVPGNAVAGRYLSALKDVGNSGSHEENNNLNREDVLDAFALLEHFLASVYGVDNLSARANAIQAKHGKVR
jgi:hypothetical protein